MRTLIKHDFKTIRELFDYFNIDDRFYTHKEKEVYKHFFRHIVDSDSPGFSLEKALNTQIDNVIEVSDFIEQQPYSQLGVNGSQPNRSKYIFFMNKGERRILFDHSSFLQLKLKYTSANKDLIIPNDADIFSSTLLTFISLTKLYDIRYLRTEIVGEDETSKFTNFSELQEIKRRIEYCNLYKFFGVVDYEKILFSTYVIDDFYSYDFNLFMNGLGSEGNRLNKPIQHHKNIKLFFIGETKDNLIEGGIFPLDVENKMIIKKDLEKFINDWNKKSFLISEDTYRDDYPTTIGMFEKVPDELIERIKTQIIMEKL